MRIVIMPYLFPGRRLIAAVSLLSAVACNAASDHQDTATPAGGASAASAVDSAARAMPDGFVLLLGNDTLAVERYARVSDTLRGEVRDVSNGNRMTYKAAVGSDARVTSLEFTLHKPGSGAATGRGRVRVQGDSVIAEQEEEGKSSTQRMAAPKGTSLYLNPSMALMEQVLRRARTVGGERPQFPVFTISTQADARVDRPTVTWVGSDSAEIARNGADGESRVRVALGENGRILGGSNSDQVQIRRLP